MSWKTKAAAVIVALLIVAAAVDSQRAPARQWGVPVAVGVIDAWQALTRHAHGGGCRYTPTCSVYGEVMVRRYGAYRGMWLAQKRIWSCSPWGGEGERWPQ